MFINVGKLLEKLDECSKKHNLPYFTGVVNYKDMNINYSSRIQALVNGDKSLFFEKDNFFAYQEEYRIIFPTLISNDPETINIGSLEDCTAIMSVEEFLNYELEFRLELYNVE